MTRSTCSIFLRIHYKIKLISFQKKSVSLLYSSLLIWSLVKTRKYLLGKYILGVLTHTTALDQLYGWNSEVRFTKQSLFSPRPILQHTDLGFSLPQGSQGSEGDPECIFSLVTHNKELLLVTYCDTTTETGVSFWTHRREHRKTETLMNRQTWKMK